MARRHTVEAIQLAIECMRDTEASWPDRMVGAKIILQEGLPKKRDAFEALFAAAGADAFIEVRFVRPSEQGERVNGHDRAEGMRSAETFRIEYNAGDDE